MHITYFNKSEQHWTREAARNNNQASDPGYRSSDFDIDDDGYMEFGDGLSPDEDDCSQTGLNILNVIFIRVTDRDWSADSSLLSQGRTPYVCGRRAWNTLIAHVPVCTWPESEYIMFL